MAIRPGRRGRRPGLLVSRVSSRRHASGPGHELERLKDAAVPGERLGWGDRFELVYQPRAGVSARWTWRMSREEYQAWHERIRIAVRSRDGDDLVQQLIWSLFRIPGFGGLRDQVKLLRRQLVKEFAHPDGNHLTIIADEVSLYASAYLAQILATIRATRTNVILAYQSLTDLEAAAGTPAAGRIIRQRIDQNCQIKLFYGSQDNLTVAARTISPWRRSRRCRAPARCGAARKATAASPSATGSRRWRRPTSPPTSSAGWGKAWRCASSPPSWRGWSSPRRWRRRAATTWSTTRASTPLPGNRATERLVGEIPTRRKAAAPCGGRRRGIQL